MVLQEFLLNNYAMIYELIGLAIMLEIGVHTTRRMRRLTEVVVILLLAEALAFTLERWTQTFPQLSIARPLLTATLYSLYPLVLICVTQITAPQDFPKQRLALLLLPWIVSVLLFYTSQWTHLVCWFHEDNHYAGGPLSWLPYIIFGFYALVFLGRNIFFFRHHSRMNRLVMYYIVGGALVGAVYYILFGEDRDYSALFTSGILLYYICVYIHSAKIDPLTGLLNRQSYYKAIETEQKTITAVVSADMNELKYYNDNFGHEAGDRALKAIALCLQKGSGKSADVYRVGGDEFMIFYRGTDEDEVRASIGRMRALLAETEYVCAFGYSMKPPLDAIEDAIRVSDRFMYEDKEALKKAVVESGGKLHPRS